VGWRAFFLQDGNSRACWFRLLAQVDPKKAEALPMIKEKALYLKILSCMVAVVFATALFAADQPAAMLYSHGGAMLNGSSMARSSAIFSGDLVQTNPDSAANINASGSIVLILNDSIVQYEGNTVKLEHGGVAVSTSKSLATRVGNLTVSPAAGVWTEFEVRDVDGQVQIAARKGDLAIGDETGTSTLPQGQQTTREQSPSQDDSQAQSDNKKKKKRKAADGPAAAASGGALDSPWAIGIGGGAILGATVWTLVQSQQPASPSK
jgi:hypothetical protein